MSIPVTSLGSQVFVHLPGMSSQVHEPCQDIHICGVCKLSFTNVENFLTHKKVVCGKEIVRQTSPSEIAITSSSSATQHETSPPTASIQTILQHPTTFITPALSSTGGSLIHSAGEMPLGGQILRVLLGNNEILFERTAETQGSTIGDLLPDETLQLLPDLSIRKGLNEKNVLNGACSDKEEAEKGKDEDQLPLEQADVIQEEERSDKSECQSIEHGREGQIFQHEEENVVSLLANQLVTTSSSLVKQDCSYPGAIVNVQCLTEETTPSSNGISIPTTTTSILPHSNSLSVTKAKPGVLVKKGKGKSSDDGSMSKSDSLEMNDSEKAQQSSKEGKQEQNAKVCLMTERVADEDDEMTSARKRMPGLFKPRKIHMCAVETCEFTTTFTKDLIRHMRKHTGERPFKCEKCSRWFSRGDKLRTHLRIHAGLKPHACNLCPYKAVDSGSLRKHMRVHTDERPYKCQICPYSARDSSQLTVHLRTHTGDHPFICSYESCNASFKTSSDLKRHIRTHTGEKPFQCQLCPYKCSIRSNLKAHMRQNHSENKTLNCSICSFIAPTKHALKEHEKAHSQPTNEDVLRCNACGFSCFGMEAMTQHQKSNPHCENASSDLLTRTKEVPASAQRKPFRCSDCDFSCMLRGNLKNHIRLKHCIGEDGVGSGAKKKGRGAAKRESPSRSRRGRGGRRGNLTGEGPPFCLRSHHCPLCDVSFVREDSWRSHIRQHQTKGEGLDIPLGPMMPSLVDSSDTAIISNVQENPCNESPSNSLISLPEEEHSNKLMSGRPFIITFEGNGKSQEEPGGNQGETGVINGFEETHGENHSLLLYVQADQDAGQNQDDDENLRNGAEILASLNQSIPMQTSLANNTKPLAIAPATANSQQHTILLTAPQPSGQGLKGHIANGSANQYIALPHEQTAIMDQLTAALQPGLQYMISGPLEAIMALPSALEQRQMTITSENQKNTYDSPVISLQLSNEKDETE